MPRECRLRATIAGLAAGMLLAGALVHAARADAVETFYKGRTITVVIGYAAGGGYDAYARLLARHMGKYIPGNPSLVPENMPGAGSLKATLYLYDVAPKDGTYIGTVGRGEALAPLLEGAKFDGTKFTWIGSAANDVSLCMSWHSSPIKTWSDLFTKEFKAAGEGSGSDPDVFSLALKNVLGAKIKLITGYPGTSDIELAIERGEVDGVCGISWSTLRSKRPDWLKEKQVNLLAQMALKGDPDLPEVPVITDLVAKGEPLQIMKLIVASEAIARPFFGPPGVPEDRVTALRRAFDATMKDPDFLAEARQQVLDVSPVTGGGIDALLRELYATNQDVVAKAASAIHN